MSQSRLQRSHSIEMNFQSPSIDQMPCRSNSSIEDLALSRSDYFLAHIQVLNDQTMFGQTYRSAPKRKRGFCDSGDINDASVVYNARKITCKDDGFEFGKRPPMLSESEW